MAGNGLSRQNAVRYYSDTSKFPGGFPTSTAGSEGVLYIDTSTDTMYLWDKTTTTYVKIADDTFEPRITNLEDKNETKQLFETISGTTSGTVSTYTNISISQDNWANQNNAFAVETEGGRPSQKTLFTATGVPITASINAIGEYALSGTPTAVNYCIVWLVTGKQVDFATAEIPENKIIEEYDYDSPFVRDNSNGQILPEIDGDDLNMRSGGFLDDVRTTDPLLVSEIEQKKQQVVTVAKDGGDFTTIQGAIDSISDSSISKPYLIKISPGTYTEDINFGAKDYISFEGAGLTLTTLDGTIILGSNFECRKLRWVTTITTNKTIVDGATNTGGSLSFNDVSIEVSTSTVGVKPIMFCIDANSLYLENVSFFYTNTSGGAVGSDTDLVDLRGNGTYVISQSAFVSSSNQSSGNLNFVKDNNSGVTSSTSLITNMHMTNASWNDTIAFIKQINNSSNKHIISNCEVTVIGAGLGNSKIMNNNSGGALSAIESCRFQSLNFTDRCVVNANNGGDEVDFTFSTINEELTDAEAFCGNGIINRVYRDNGNLVVNTDIIDLGTLIGTPTNDSLQDMFNIGFNAGWVSGQAITDNLDGTIDLTSGTGYVRTSNDEQAPLKSFDISAVTNFNLDYANNYVYNDYNSGTPIVAKTSVGSTITDNENDKYEIYEVYKETDDTLHITPHFHRAKNVGSIFQKYVYSKARIERADAEGGLVLGESADGNRYVTMTLGKVLVKANPIPISNFDSSGSDVFDYLYRNSPSGYLKVADQTQWNNTQYDDGSGTLATMNANWYKADYVYLEADGHLAIQFGQAQYANLGSALEDTTPVPVERLQSHALLIGRYIIKQGTNIAVFVQSSFEILFGTSAISDHGNLAGLADDDHAQYLLLAGRGGQIINDNISVNNLTVGDTTAPPRGNLRVYGTASSISAGAHQEFVTSTDVYPVRQLLNNTHNSIADGWDLYNNGTNWLRGSAQSGFVFQKGSSAFSLLYDSGGVQGTIASLNIGWSIDDSGNMYVLEKYGVGEASPETKMEITDTEPYLTLHNSTQEDIEGGRESRINFKGEQSGGEETTLARIQASHDGTGDDQKGDLIFYTNDGSDGDTPTEAMRIDSNQDVYIGGLPTTNVQKLGLVGTDSNISGAHLAYYTSSDLAYPVFQQLNWTHDNIALTFDAYYDGTGWKSSDVGSNYSIQKVVDELRFYYNSGTSAGSAMTWSTAMFFDTNGLLHSLPTYNNGISGGRDVYVQSSGQFSYNTSSLESKINISTLTNWENIYNLEPVQYNNRLKDEDGNYTEEHDGILDRGLIADDVNTYYPNIIYKDPIYNELEEIIGEKIVGMDYKKLIPDMIKCIQDLQARIIILENGG